VFRSEGAGLRYLYEYSYCMVERCRVKCSVTFLRQNTKLRPLFYSSVYRTAFSG